MMKRIFKIAVVCMLVLGFVFYAVTLWYSEGSSRFDATGRVNLITEERRIELPWYLSGAELYHSQTGKDADGDDYSKLYYDLPAFLEIEMQCVVNWTDETAVAYVGELRCMDVIDLDYPNVEWN